MPSELVIHADYQGGMKLLAGDGEHTVVIDYPLEPGQQVDGLTPLKLLLASVAGCAGNTVALLMKKRDQPLQGLEVVARGQRRDEHPTVFTAIDVEFILHGAGIDPAVVEHCIAVADGQLCPVWAMIKPGTPIATSYRLVD